jgi:hypothetical protein
MTGTQDNEPCSAVAQNLEQSLNEASEKGKWSFSILPAARPLAPSAYLSAATPVTRKASALQSFFTPFSEHRLIQGVEHWSVDLCMAFSPDQWPVTASSANDLVSA